MFVVNLVSILLRLFVRKATFSSVFSVILYILPIAPTIALYSFLVKAGSPRRDASGALISPGDDLNQPGLLDWSWDVVYVTWACQIGSGLFGGWVWYLYLIVCPSLVQSIQAINPLNLDTCVCWLQGMVGFYFTYGIRKI